MSAERTATLEAALLCISEARERVEAAARLARRDGEPALAEALAEADRRLHDTYGDLMRAVYLPAAGTSQLRLAASG